MVSPSRDQLLSQPCTQSQQAHVSHSCFFVQAKLSEGQCLPRCTVAEDHEQSMFFASCRTVEEEGKEREDQEVVVLFGKRLQ